MQVTLTVRHDEASDSIKRYTQEQVEALAKYFDRLVEADVILDHEVHGDRYLAEVRLHTSNDTHFASAEAGDFRTAVDQTVEKLRRQLDRHKGRLNSRPLSKEDRALLLGTAVATALEAKAGEGPPREWDRITSDDAMARLQATGEEVLVFVDSRDGAVKIARRDEEGGIDVVEAEAFEIEER